jgi:hypothetical protein
MVPVTTIEVELTIGDTTALTVIAGGDQASSDDQTDASCGSTPLPMTGILRPEYQTVAPAMITRK